MVLCDRSPHAHESVRRDRNALLAALARAPVGLHCGRARYGAQSSQAGEGTCQRRIGIVLLLVASGVGKRHCDAAHRTIVWMALFSRHTSAAPIVERRTAARTIGRRPDRRRLSRDPLLRRRGVPVWRSFSRRLPGASSVGPAGCSMRSSVARSCPPSSPDSPRGADTDPWIARFALDTAIADRERRPGPPDANLLRKQALESPRPSGAPRCPASRDDSEIAARYFMRWLCGKRQCSALVFAGRADASSPVRGTTSMAMPYSGDISSKSRTVFCALSTT